MADVLLLFGDLEGEFGGELVVIGELEDVVLDLLEVLGLPGAFFVVLVVVDVERVLCGRICGLIEKGGLLFDSWDSFLGLPLLVFSLIFAFNCLPSLLFAPILLPPIQNPIKNTASSPHNQSRTASAANAKMRPAPQHPRD